MILVFLLSSRRRWEIISWKLLRPVPDFMILKTKSPYLQLQPQKNKNSTKLTQQFKSEVIRYNRRNLNIASWWSICWFLNAQCKTNTSKHYPRWKECGKVNLETNAGEYRRKWLAATSLVMGATIMGGTLVMGATSNTHILPRFLACLYYWSFILIVFKYGHELKLWYEDNRKQPSAQNPFDICSMHSGLRGGIKKTGGSRPIRNFLIRKN